jgi:hypothetical protein
MAARPLLSDLSFANSSTGTFARDDRGWRREEDLDVGPKGAPPGVPEVDARTCSILLPQIHHEKKERAARAFRALSLECQVAEREGRLSSG